MRLEHYHALTAQLQANLESSAEVLALIVLGSMSGAERQPDEHSDHDFFVITESGKQQAYRDSTDWLPYPEQLVLHFQETDHGCKAIYNDGHILEYAIFDSQELNLARINTYRVLFDKANIAEIMPTLQMIMTSGFDTQRIFDSMISNILVGAMRAGRGETLSAHAFIKQYALQAFMRLCWHQIAPDSPHHDNLDPFRRFEKQFPQIAADLNKTMQLPIPEAAKAMLRLSDVILASTLPDNRAEAIKVIHAYLDAQEN